jgi:hypothetical protein
VPPQLIVEKLYAGDSDENSLEDSEPLDEGQPRKMIINSTS